jgi:hypothetical protein
MFKGAVPRKSLEYILTLNVRLGPNYGSPTVFNI